MTTAIRIQFLASQAILQVILALHMLETRVALSACWLLPRKGRCERIERGGKVEILLASFFEPPFAIIIVLCWCSFALNWINPAGKKRKRKEKRERKRKGTRKEWCEQPVD